MIRRILLILIFLVLLVCALGVISIRPLLPTELPLLPGEGEVQQTEGVTETAETAGVAPTPAPPTPTPGPTATPRAFLARFSTGPDVVIENGRAYVPIEAGNLQPTSYLPRHGLIIAVVLPMLIFGIPWIFLEVFLIRYTQPRGLDLATVLIKAKDGLFVEAVVSMTARRMLTLAATRMTWPRVQALVEKTVEQELIHMAIGFASLDELEQNMKLMTEHLLDLPILDELLRDFGVEVLRFNIELRYTSETREALRRKAEASAGGNAYLAYAAAAHLDPERPESRELYRIYQETSSQVDAARNLGGGIAALVERLAGDNRKQREDEESKE